MVHQLRNIKNCNFAAMITIEQLKVAKDRVEALNRYLDIEAKTIQLEEEQLRTQDPGFWDDAKRAEEQMKKVKGLEKWIVGYKEVKLLVEELELAFDFHKEGELSEEEVDTAYAKSIEAIEALELKNMLRQEEDAMDCVLKINSGAGHDAQFASYMLPTTMVFVPSKDGHSHCEPEFTSTELCTEGASVLLNAVLKCDAAD